MARSTVRVRILLSLSLPLIAAAGCHGGQGECRPTFEYRINVDVSKAPRAACQVELRAGTAVASYAFETLPEPYMSPCSYQQAQPPCTPADGSPQPSWCAGSVCSIAIDFKPEIARDLSTFMGAESFRMVVTCGGEVVADTMIQPVRQQCYG